MTDGLGIGSIYTDGKTTPRSHPKRLATAVRSPLAYEKDRTQTMKENMSLLMERLKENVGDTNGLQYFSSIACYFVYGHAQQGRQLQEQEIDSDPDYGPDDAEAADTKYEIVIAEEENTQANSSSELIIHNNRSASIRAAESGMDVVVFGLWSGCSSRHYWSRGKALVQHFSI